MDAILICPGERPSVGFLGQAVPLVALPILGQNLLSYWLETFANQGAKEILVLATDRPELVRSAVGDGSRWGLRVQVRSELNEVSPAEVLAKLAAEPATSSLSSGSVFTMENLPGMPDQPLFRSYRDWFTSVIAWMPHAARLNRIGLREVQPGVWCGRRTQVAASAKLVAPCWLGDNARVGADSVIGPEAVLESRAVVDRASEVRSSVVGPDTYAGALTRIEHSIAWGSTLIDWRTGSCTQVPDSFLLCSLGQNYLPADETGSAWWRRTFGRLLRRPFTILASSGAKSPGG